jgi:hypothetical protein
MLGLEIELAANLSGKESRLVLLGFMGRPGRHETGSRFSVNSRVSLQVGD